MPEQLTDTTEEVELRMFTNKFQQELKKVMEFMIDLGIVKIKRMGENKELVLHYVDDVEYVVNMEIKK